MLRTAGDRSGAARVTGLLGDAMFGRYRLDAALALLEPAATEFADLGDDPGLAALLGQLARFQMLRQVDFGAAVANADRALAIAERLDRVDLVADVIVTRGVALVSMGRAYEGIGCLETGLSLAQRHGLLATEIRARTNMGGPADRPRPPGGLRDLAGRASSRPAGSGTGRASRCSSETPASARSRRARGAGPAPRSRPGWRRPQARRSGSSCSASTPSCGSRVARTPTRSSTRPEPGSPRTSSTSRT